VTRRDQPPRFALRMLDVAMPDRLREAVVGDLEEEWRAAIDSRALPSECVVLRPGRRGGVPARSPQHFSEQQQARRDPRRKGDGLMETLWNDVRYGARMLMRTPGFTFVAILTLALGLGANTAIFSIVNALLIKPLPLPDSERLLSVNGLDAKGRQQYLSFPDFEDLQKQATLFDGFSAMVRRAPIHGPSRAAGACAAALSPTISSTSSA